MSDKPTMYAFGREWPMTVTPKVVARITITLPAQPLAEVQADIQQRLEGLDAEIDVHEMDSYEVREPERTEYHALQDKAYQEAFG